MDEGTDQAGDDNNDSHEERGHDVGERETGGEENRQKQKREGDEPLDVPHILRRNEPCRRVSIDDYTNPDLARLTVATELSLDGSRAEIGGHGEVRETGGGEDDDGELVEEPGTAGTLHRSVSSCR